MNVYQVVMEEVKKNGDVFDIVEHVQAHDFETVSNTMVARAKELDYTLKAIRYILTIVEMIPAWRPVNSEDE